MDFEFRIIHKSRCDDRAFNNSLPLDAFIGPNGLIKLTSMLSYGTLDVARGGTPKQGTANFPPLDAWVDFLRRVQVPYYEESRLAFYRREVWDYHSDWNEVAPYLQDNLERIATEED